MKSNIKSILMAQVMVASAVAPVFADTVSTINATRVTKADLLNDKDSYLTFIRNYLLLKRYGTNVEVGSVVMIVNGRMTQYRDFAGFKAALEALKPNDNVQIDLFNHGADKIGSSYYGLRTRRFETVQRLQERAYAINALQQNPPAGSIHAVAYLHAEVVENRMILNVYDRQGGRIIRTLTYGLMNFEPDTMVPVDGNSNPITNMTKDKLKYFYSFKHKLFDIEPYTEYRFVINSPNVVNLRSENHGITVSPCACDINPGTGSKPGTPTVDPLITQDNTDFKDVTLLAGKDRFATALDIAKRYKLNHGIDNIVIVGSNKIVDGLAATPFAVQKNAPILISAPNGIPQDTYNFIKEQLAEKPSIGIVIIGGINSVPMYAQEQLAKLTDNIERISGDDRQATSYELAKRINNGNTDRVFMVGGFGEVDAMSIASRAANLNLPIIVSGDQTRNLINPDVREFLRGKAIDIIGGPGSVPSTAEGILSGIAKNTVRVAGADRQATNAAIIERYYSNPKNPKDKIKGVFLAKDGQSARGVSDLIDALAAGTLAGKENEPIVLATKTLSQDQINALKSMAQNKATITQIGLGIKAAAMLQLKEVLGFI